MAAERTQARGHRGTLGRLGARSAGRRARAGGDARTEGLREGQSIAGLQRARLLKAAVGLLVEKGYEGFSAGGVCERAGVSRRTFYEVFENRQACLAAILTDAEARVERLVADIGLDRLDWSERVRMGLWVILCLIESDPALFRVCLVESQRAGGVVQRERERLVGRLTTIIDEGRLQDGPASVAGELTAEALVGAVGSVMAARLASRFKGRKADVRGLLGELMGMIVLPYDGPAAARREIRRALPTAPPVHNIASPDAGADPADPLAGLAIRLTYRTARVLQALSELTAGGAGASNRQVGERAGIGDAGQVSKLLWRLQRHGLLENAAEGNLPRGEANSWHLTATGRQLLRSITTQADPSQKSAA